MEQTKPNNSFNLSGMAHREAVIFEDLAVLMGREQYAKVRPRDRILTLDEWLLDDNYSGELGKHLYPFWKKELRNVCGQGGLNEFPYLQIITTGSLSSGKTYWSTCAVWLRMLYLFSMLPDLQGFLGMAPSSKISMAYLSISLKIANMTGYGQLKTILDSTSYFKQVFVRDPNIESMISYPVGLFIIPGSDSSHFRGTNMVGSIFSESNFAKHGGGNEGDLAKAQKIYSDAKDRMETRFSNRVSQFAGLNILESSNTHKESFTERTIKESKDVRKTKVIVTRLFDTKPEGTYSTKRFLFYLGNEINPPRVINKVIEMESYMDPVSYAMVSGEESQDWFDSLPVLDQLNFCMVPEDFRGACERTPDAALQNIIGFSLAVRGKFFTNTVDYGICVEQGHRLGVVHPFTQQTFTIGMKDNNQIIHFLNKETLRHSVGKNPLYIHMDAAETGCSAGISGSYILNRPMEPAIVVLAFMIRIVPPDGDDRISIEKMRQFVYDLSSMGIAIAKITFDQFQSHIFRGLELKGYKAELFSVQRTDVPWSTTSDLFFKRRIALYDYIPFKEEFFSVIHDRVTRKITVCEGGTKDVADTVVGSVYNAWLDMDKDDIVESQVDFINDVLGHWAAKEKDEREVIMESFFGTSRPLNWR
jgi:hypothetical protein